jgi:hypothetical protein
MKCAVITINYLYDGKIINHAEIVPRSSKSRTPAADKNRGFLVLYLSCRRLHNGRHFCFPSQAEKENTNPTATPITRQMYADWPRTLDDLPKPEVQPQASLQPVSHERGVKRHQKCKGIFENAQLALAVQTVKGSFMYTTFER